MKNASPLYCAFCAVLAALSALALQQHFQLSLLPALLLLPPCFFLFFHSGRLRSKRIQVIAGALAFLFSLSAILYRSPQFPQYTGILWLLRFVGLFLLFLSLISLLFHRLHDQSLLLSEETERDLRPHRLALVFFGSMLLLFLWFLLWLLYRFPGCMSPDSNWQLLQARGEMALSNHHPIVHTMILRFFIQLGGLLFPGNPSLSLAAYSATQALLLAASFAWLIVSLYKNRVKLVPLLLLYLSFFLLPYHAAYSVTMLKDVWFSSFVLLLCTTLFRLIRHFREETQTAPVLDLILLFLSALGMCLFRTNGLYAFVLLLPFVFLLFFKKNKSVLLLSLLAMFLAMFIRGPLYRALQIIPPDPIESLSVPAQHIARAIVEGADLTPQQEAQLSRIMDLSEVPERYLPYLADPIKDLVRQTGDQDYLRSHKGEFLRLWLELGWENPGAYLRAHIDLTSGYWYPRTDGVVMYPYFTDTGEAMMYCKLPLPLAKGLLHMAGTLPRLPFVNLLFSNGAAVWLLLFLFGLCLVNKQYSWLPLFVPALGIWATLLIATPLNNEFRYAYCIFTTLPLLTMIPFCPVSPKIER